MTNCPARSARSCPKSRRNFCARRRRANSLANEPCARLHLLLKKVQPPEGGCSRLFSRSLPHVSDNAFIPHSVLHGLLPFGSGDGIEVRVCSRIVEPEQWFGPW